MIRDHRELRDNTRWNGGHPLPWHLRALNFSHDDRWDGLSHWEAPPANWNHYGVFIKGYVVRMYDPLTGTWYGSDLGMFLDFVKYQIPSWDTEANKQIIRIMPRAKVTLDLADMTVLHNRGPLEFYKWKISQEQDEN